MTNVLFKDSQSLRELSVRLVKGYSLGVDCDTPASLIFLATPLQLVVVISKLATTRRQQKNGQTNVLISQRAEKVGKSLRCHPCKTHQSIKLQNSGLIAALIILVYKIASLLYKQYATKDLVFCITRSYI